MIGAGTTHGAVAGSSAADLAEAITNDAFVNTANIKDYTAPEESRDTSEDSYLDAQDAYKEFVAGMKDGGEISLVLKWDQTDVGQVVMNTAFEGDGMIYGQIEFTSGEKFSYKGVVTGRGVEVPKNETITRSYKVKITGKPEWT